MTADTPPDDSLPGDSLSDDRLSDDRPPDDSLPGDSLPGDSLPAHPQSARPLPVHADAVATLTAYARTPPAAEGEQDRLRREFLAALRGHPDATRRDGPPAHLTVGVLVMDPAGARVLLTHHRKADAWFQFGGHIEDDDPTLRAAAERELAEESGLTGLQVSPRPIHLDRHALPAGFGTCREHLDVRYLAVAPADAVPVVSAESHDVRWFDVDDLPPRAAADLAGLIAAGRHLIETGVLP